MSIQGNYFNNNNESVKNDSEVKLSKKRSVNSVSSSKSSGSKKIKHEIDQKPIAKSVRNRLNTLSRSESLPSSNLNASEVPKLNLQTSYDNISLRKEKDYRKQIIDFSIDPTVDLSTLSDQQILQAIKYSTKYIEDKNNVVIATKTHKSTRLTKQELVDLVRNALNNIKNIQSGQDFQLQNVTTHSESKFYAAIKLNKEKQLTLKLFRIDENILGQGGTGVVKAGEKLTGREIVQKSAITPKGIEKIKSEVVILQSVGMEIENYPHLKEKYPQAWDNKNNLILIQPKPETHNEKEGRYSTDKLTNDLHKHLESNPEYKQKPFDFFLPLAKDLATGMAILHEINYIHSDFKKINILINKDNRAVIADLEGCKKLTEGAFTEEQSKHPLTALSASVTSASIINKIYHYASIKDKQKFNEYMKAHDRFSLGATLYTGLTGVAMPTKSALIMNNIFGVEVTNETFSRKEFINLPPPIQLMLKRLLKGDLTITPENVLHTLNHYNDEHEISNMMIEDFEEEMREPTMEIEQTMEILEKTNEVQATDIVDSDSETKEDNPSDDIFEGKHITLPSTEDILASKQNNSDFLSKIINNEIAVDAVSDDDLLQLIAFNTKFIENEDGNLYSLKSKKNIGLKKPELINIIKESINTLKGKPIFTTHTINISNSNEIKVVIRQKNNVLSLHIYDIVKSIEAKGGTGVIRFGRKISGKEVAEKKRLPFTQRSALDKEFKNLNRVLNAVSEIKENYPFAYDKRNKIVVFIDKKFIDSQNTFIIYDRYPFDLNNAIEKKLSNEEKKIIARDIVTALAMMHQQNYIHSDVNVKNVFITKEKRAALADFETIIKLKNNNEQFSSNELTQPLEGFTPANTSANILKGIHSAITQKDRHLYNESLKKHDNFCLGVLLYKLYTENDLPVSLQKTLLSQKIENCISIIGDKAFNSKEFLQLPTNIKLAIQNLLSEDNSVNLDELLKTFI